jgi:hypothetical protein
MDEKNKAACGKKTEGDRAIHGFCKVSVAPSTTYRR